MIKKERYLSTMYIHTINMHTINIINIHTTINLNSIIGSKY